MPAQSLSSPLSVRPKPLFNEADVRRGLELFLGDGRVVEIRALDATHAEDRYPGVWFGYFPDADHVVAALSQLKTAEGIYITLNPVVPALLARSSNRLRKAGKTGVSVSDTDVLVRRWMLVDCDPKRPSGISSTEEEHGQALMRAQIIREELAADGWPEPILADSANGVHLLYAIDLAALNDLAKIGWGRWQNPKPGPSGGRPTQIFHLLAASEDDDDVGSEETY